MYWLHRLYTIQQYTITFSCVHYSSFMSSNNLDLVGVKKIIRSLLISAKDGLNSNQLEQDFISQIGTPIPYESYGHLSLESFLYSIPDVVLVTKRSKPLHLTGVATNETSHIVRMVQMQTGELLSAKF